MKKVILDTSFIMACSKQKIDFFRFIEEEGLEPIVPSQTISELKGLDAKLAIQILSRHKFEEVSESGKDADNAIVNFTRKNPDTIVATLDIGLQKRIKNRKLIIRGKKQLEIV